MPNSRPAEYSTAKRNSQPIRGQTIQAAGIEICVSQFRLPRWQSASIGEKRTSTHDLLPLNELVESIEEKEDGITRTRSAGGVVEEQGRHWETLLRHWPGACVL
jgi:hypothetical protein